ncbi:hypothetical protein GCM10015535_64470 [Streptomyces gelaticus]|uniref:DUF3592 domain-containing protein n=1 Tax=Streptomyces gelaticus TaxID=285446 RepID=A0ABQ2W829_9ACTN|nr:hypothetical protein [Streptomyces gelaticus]GGV95934.1 hypothetical protein GCM10015535_64470 [Streptomyces gelaticus]
MNAGCALLIAIPSGWLGAWGWSATGEGSVGSNKAIGLLLGLALGALAIAATQIARALRGERGEYFEVRRGGLVHGSQRGAAGWSWNRVTSLHVDGDAVNGLATRLGNGYRVEIDLDDGTRLRADGLTERAGDLGRVLLTQCPHVALKPRIPWYGRAGSWLLAGAAACAAAIAAMIFYITDHPDKEHRIPAGEGMIMVQSTEPGISEAGYFFLTMGMLVCAITAVTLVIAYVRGRAYR